MQPFHFTNTQALLDQLDAVVNDVSARLGVDKVSLFAWSRGNLVVGPYSYLHPEKVQNVVFFAGSYKDVFPANPPNPLPQPGPSLEVLDRAHVEATWTSQVDNVAFPGQQDPAIRDPIWESLMARDPLGSTWGTNGIQRFPSADYWGWNAVQHQASRVTVPALVLNGLVDTMSTPATAVQLYNDLGSEKKVLIEVDGGSHFMVWEGSTSPTWKGPHATLQDAVVQWITSETYQGATTGTFDVHADGSITQASSFAVSGFPSSTTAGVAGSFTVRAKNSDDATATGYLGTVHFSSSDTAAALPADYTFTLADQGVHTFSATLKTAGTQSLTATDRTTASLIGSQTDITVNPAAANQFTISASSTVTTGVPFSLTVKVEDSYGNVVTGYTGTIHFSSTDTTATLPVDYTFTAADKGVHTFTGLVLRTKGKQTITITDILNDSLTGSVIENVL